MIKYREAKRFTITLVAVCILAAISIIGVEVTSHRVRFTHPMAPPPFAAQENFPQLKNTPACLSALIALETIVTEGTEGKAYLNQGIVALKNGAYTQYDALQSKADVISTKLKTINLPAYIKLRKECIDGL